MASVRHINGSYYIDVYLGRDADGKKIMKRTTFKPSTGTKAEQKRALDKFVVDFESKCRNGDIYCGDKLTFNDFIPIWKNGEYFKNIGPKNQDEYISAIKRRFIPPLGHLPMDKIKTYHIDKILQEMEGDGLSPKTLKNTLVIINNVMRYAVKKNVISDNPCSRCDVPKVTKNNKIEFFNVEQTEKFLKILDEGYPIEYKDHYRVNKATGTKTLVKGYTEYHHVPLMLKVAFYLLIFSGVRKSELMAMTWNDIDFDKETITINKAFSKSKSTGQYIKGTKTESGNRKMTISKKCIQLLKQWHSEEEQLMISLGNLWEGYDGNQFDNNFVLIQMENGGPIGSDTLYNRFKSILRCYNESCKNEEDKLPDITLHDLRHTNATILIAQGTDIETVSHRLGHSKPSITEDIYGHPLIANDEKASKMLNETIKTNL